MSIRAGDNKNSKQDSTQNSSHNISVIIKTDNQKEIHATGVGDLQSRDSKFENIRAIEVKLEGNLDITNFKENNTNQTLHPNSSSIFSLPNIPGQYRIECNVQFSNLVDDVPGRLIINLKYD